MLGIGILLGFHLLGMILQHALSLPLPANVLGLLLFVVSLFAGWIKLEWVEVSANFLLRHMMLFFIPIIVASQLFFPFMKEQWLAIGLSWLGSTLIALFVTGWATKAWTAGEKEANE
ncbi:CidA/LrgA family protein [Cohnella herbarum]|uniref:CidA/LrgA family protein n=1 Tax=Cohnella herbarum TaxID=2728023 RepID=A0A7Z2VMV3_9BACL|nr:CidA/LrgA family protein [Cohnella herbarum]QJD85755.1 CidA/LrgA family protein [Cohnella herbarum]